MQTWLFYFSWSVQISFSNFVWDLLSRRFWAPSKLTRNITQDKSDWKSVVLERFLRLSWSDEPVELMFECRMFGFREFSCRERRSPAPPGLASRTPPPPAWSEVERILCWIIWLWRATSVGQKSRHVEKKKKVKHRIMGAEIKVRTNVRRKSAEFNNYKLLCPWLCFFKPLTALGKTAEVNLIYIWVRWHLTILRRHVLSFPLPPISQEEKHLEWATSLAAISWLLGLIK